MARGRRRPRVVPLPPDGSPDAHEGGSPMIVLWIVLGIVVLLLLSAILSYNRFVSQRNLIRNAWANIDTELRRRYDLIPNLVETVKGYAAHEREVFEEVALTRATA